MAKTKVSRKLSPEAWNVLRAKAINKELPVQERYLALVRFLEFSVPNGDWMAYKGTLLLAMDRHEESLQAFNSALRFDPRSWKFAVLKIQALESLGFKTEGLNFLQHAVTTCNGVDSAEVKKIRRRLKS